MSVGPRERHEFWNDIEYQLQPVWQGCLDRARAVLGESGEATGLTVAYPAYPASFIANFEISGGSIEMKPAFPLLTYLWFRGKPGEKQQAEIWSGLGWGLQPTAELLAQLSMEDRVAFLLGHGVDARANELAQVAVEFFIGHEIGHHNYHHKKNLEVRESELMADSFAINLAFKRAGGEVQRAMDSMSGFLAGSLSCRSRDTLYPSKAERLRRVASTFTEMYGPKAYQQWHYAETARCHTAGVNCFLLPPP